MISIPLKQVVKKLKLLQKNLLKNYYKEKQLNIYNTFKTLLTLFQLRVIIFNI